MTNHPESENPAANRVCVDCGLKSPITNTEFTLISSKYGWRLSRSVDGTGRKQLIWRCPECWRNYKAAGGRL